MLATTNAIPISDSMFGKNSEIHQGEMAAQSMIGGCPTVK
jgi:hypothetical protein